MKNPLLFALLAGCLSAFAQDSAISSGPVITERGPHHRVWEYYTTATNDNQETLVVTNSYTELQTGISFLNNGQWVDSSIEIEPFEKGAVARHGQHQVIFSPQFNVPGVIDLLTSDGQRVRGTPVGLAYHDDATGKSVLIATLKDSLGELLPPNQVIYRDCFSNTLADIRYTYTLAGFEQDVILRENPPSPQEFGFDPATTRLEVWTEFQGTSNPQISSSIAWHTPFTPTGHKMAEPDTIDDTLQFGAMRTGPGKAFALDSDRMDGTELIPVVKRWQKVQGNTYLVESVVFSSVEASLQALPSAAPEGALLRRQPADHLDLPATHPQLAKTAPMPIASPEVQAFYRHSIPTNRTQNQKQLASNTKATSNHGFVLDYTLLNAATNFTFCGDTTYYVSGYVYLRGTTTIEGGTVVKYATNTSALVQLTDGLTCQTTAYRPAVFTAVDDDSVGEIISGSTGVPTMGGYGGVGMIDLTTMAADLSYLRFSFARQALYIYNYNGVSIRHSQFVKCQNSIVEYLSTCYLRNVLFQQISNVFYGDSYTNHCEHLTLSECARVGIELTTGTSSLKLTNSILVQITNATTVALITNNCASASSTLGNFQAVGAGNLYLANNAWRGIGTTSINAALLADLTNRTTYPPLILTNDFITNTVLTTVVPRNTGTPDLGYHYDPIDYAFNGNVLSNATLVLTNGVAIAVYGTKGIELQTGANLYSVGTPLNLNHWVRYQAVQEQPMQWGTSNSTVALFNLAANYTTLPSLNFRFTDLSMLSAHIYKRYIVNLNTYYMVTNMSFTDCQLRGGYLYFLPYYYDSRTMTLAATNNLVERSVWSMTQGYSSSATAFAVKFYNNLFRLSTITLVDTVNNVSWYIYDNLFDQTTLSSSGTYPVNANNGYYSSSTLPGGSGNVFPTFPLYQNSSLDRPYYLTNTSTLINAGSRLASAAGLYHYTVLTNQTKEASSQVDIGFHYVALANGMPVDADNDGLPDYFEDRNGNGVTDSGETSMNNPDTDGDGRNDGQEVAEGTDPLDSISVTPVRLTYFKFNSGNFNGEQSESPITSSGATLVSSFDGNGAQLSTGSGTFLKYREVETSGKVNIVCSNISIRFMFKPSWSSTSRSGSGPGQVIRLWEYGDPDLASGGMALSIDSTGNTLTFTTKDNAGNTASASGTISFISGQWQEIQLVARKPSWFYNSTIYIYANGIKVGGNENVTALPYPPASVRTGGFCIGCSSTTGSTKQAQGVFDEFEIFNYDLGDTGANLRLDFPISAKASSNPNKIELSLRFDPNVPCDIKRRVEGGAYDSWTNIASHIRSWSVIDTNIVGGQRYEYGIFQTNDLVPNFITLNSMLAGVNVTNSYYRGIVILLVDRTITNAIYSGLEQFKQDLIGDGWKIIRHDVQRHDDYNWSANTNNIVTNRNIIISDYNNNSNVRSVVLIGHVSIPYSGFREADSHNSSNGIDHRGAWPTDGYYGDIDGIWHDSSVNYTNVNNDFTSNIPNDNKFDEDFFPTNPSGIAKIELSVGRIDFANLPAFITATNSKSEVDLLNQYFAKNHRYRTGQLIFANRAMSVAFFGDASEDSTVHKNANYNASALFGFDSGKIISGHMFKEKINCLWGFQGGYGNYNSINGNYWWLNQTTTDLANLVPNEPPIGFYLLKGSFFGDFAYFVTNNFLRATLGTPNYGLAAMWTRPHIWYFQNMAVGDSLGDAFVKSVNINNTSSDPTRQFAIIGDPTLRLNIIPPPVNFAVTSATGSSVTLGWGGAFDPAIQYGVFRAAGTNSVFTNMLNSTPINGSIFTDINPSVTEKYYQVRAIKVVNTGGGSYTNYSQGIITSY